MEGLLRSLGFDRDSTTNLWRRPGQKDIAYSDGDAMEQHLLECLQSTSDVSLSSTALKEHCVDWPTTYHLSRSRANLLRPFTGRLSGRRVLEVGAGCGAITRFLGESGAEVLALEGTARRARIARERSRDLPNVAVVVEDFFRFECIQRFDVITLIGVLEYAATFSDAPDPFAALLSRCRALLEPDGVLVLAIENQLGLKYFAGAPEDHVGRPVHGLEDSYSRGQAKTFGAHQLRHMLATAGFEGTTTLAPFPDYKLPVSIVSEAGFKHPGFDPTPLIAAACLRDPQARDPQHFRQELVWPVVVGNGLGLDLANSFLVVASGDADASSTWVEPGALAYHYSAERRPEFCQQLVFHGGDKDAEIQVHAQPLPFVTAPRRRPRAEDDAPTLTHHLAGSTYVQGVLLADRFKRVLSRDGWTFADLGLLLREYAEVLSNLSGHDLRTGPWLADGPVRLPGDFVDALPHNIVRTPDGGHVLIDREWETSLPLSMAYLWFRLLLWLSSSLGHLGSIDSHPNLTVGEFIDEGLRAAGVVLSPSLRDTLLDREVQLQAAVTGDADRAAALRSHMSSPVKTRNALAAFLRTVMHAEALQQANEALQAQVATRGAELQQAADRLERAALATQAQSDQIRALNAKLLAMESSNSWRLTRPLRALRRLLGGDGG